MNAPVRAALRLLGAAVLTGAVAVVVVNQKSLARERTDHQALLRDQGEAAQLTVENGELGHLRAENETVQKLRAENHDLPRLRNEIHLRRDEAAEARKLRAENQLAGTGPAPGGAAALPADFLVRDRLVDAGLSTPEATVQTFFHAISQGDIVRALQCDASVADHPMSKEQQDAEQAQMQKELGAFPGYRIAGKNVLSDDTIQLGIQCLPGGVIAPMKLKLVGGEWKIDN